MPVLREWLKSLLHPVKNHLVCRITVLTVFRKEQLRDHPSGRSQLLPRPWDKAQGPGEHVDFWRSIVFHTRFLYALIAKI